LGCTDGEGNKLRQGRFAPDSKTCVVGTKRRSRGGSHLAAGTSREERERGEQSRKGLTLARKAELKELKLLVDPRTPHGDVKQFPQKGFLTWVKKRGGKFRGKTVCGNSYGSNIFAETMGVSFISLSKPVWVLDFGGRPEGGGRGKISKTEIVWRLM